jgi:hypothetical protein
MGGKVNHTNSTVSFHIMMARRLNQLRKSTLSTHRSHSSRIYSFRKLNLFIDDQLTFSSSILSSSPRTPGKKVIKGDPIITGIRLRPFLERFDILLEYSSRNDRLSFIFN